MHRQLWQIGRRWTSSGRYDVQDWNRRTCRWNFFRIASIGKVIVKGLVKNSPTSKNCVGMFKKTGAFKNVKYDSSDQNEVESQQS